MKKLFFGLFALGYAIGTHLQAETLYGPGSINIATNEAIIINTVGGIDDSAYSYSFYIDGFFIYNDLNMLASNPRFAVAGPHTLTISNQYFITFQRIQGSAVKSALIVAPYDNGGSVALATNMIQIPAGKTAQFFAVIGDTGNGSGTLTSVHPQGSTNVYRLNLYINSTKNSSGPHPQITGPATVQVSSDFGSAVVSYYLTDEVLQVPPAGFLRTPAPALEVNIEKSYNLTNWTPVGAFNTEAETGAYYRLKMLR